MSEKASWKLCKGTGFHEVDNLLCLLKTRLRHHGCDVQHFYTDNCCHWRAKLNSIFQGCALKLDPFHAIQRVTSKIPKRGKRGSPSHRLRSRVAKDFRLYLGEAGDHGKERTMPTTSQECMVGNTERFKKQREGVEYEGTTLIPQSTIQAIDKLLIHYWFIWYSTILWN